MGQPVVHFEFWSENTEELTEFYSKVFDWNVKFVPEMNYYFVDTESEQGIGGGIMKPQKGPWPGNLTFYIDVDDLATYREKIEAAGGKIVVSEMDVPGVGSLMLFEDPDGRILGCWKKNPAAAEGTEAE